MDVLYFLKDRTRLIRQYYEQAAQPFSEIIRKIEAEEEPYLPPYSEESEPAFLNEWNEASDLLEATGRCCVSMLSAALQLYFKTWERDLGLTCGTQFKADFKRDGMVGGYRICFTEQLGIEWNNCPADLAIIEQVVLVRNRDQHPECIISHRVTHTDQDRARHPRLFFVNDVEAALLDDGDGYGLWMSPTLHVSKDKLMTAIANVETLCEWLEDQMFNAKYPRQSERAIQALDGTGDPKNSYGKGQQS